MSEDAPVGPIADDKYEILGVLGEGGTGVVYDAIRAADRKPIALKVMHAALAGDAQIRGRFQREAAILRRPDGAHVCPILESGEPVIERAPPTSSTSDTAVDASAPTLADSTRHASPLISPVESSPRRAATETTAEETDVHEHDRVWLLVWIAVAITSIAVGVCIALRT